MRRGGRTEGKRETGGEEEGDDDDAVTWVVAQDNDTLRSLCAWHGTDEWECFDLNKKRLFSYQACGRKKVKASVGVKLNLMDGTRVKMGPKIGDGWGDSDDDEEARGRERAQKRQKKQEASPARDRSAAGGAAGARNKGGTSSSRARNANRKHRQQVRVRVQLTGHL